MKIKRILEYLSILLGLLVENFTIYINNNIIRKNVKNKLYLQSNKL